jgi:hypothetical protein
MPRKRRDFEDPKSPTRHIGIRLSGREWVLLGALIASERRTEPLADVSASSILRKLLERECNRRRIRATEVASGVWRTTVGTTGY